jgi:hypothetical protein
MPPTRCAARSKRTHEQCGQYVTGGATVCRWHGGEAPQSKSAAGRRRQQQEAERIMRMLGEPIDTTPAEALLDTVKRTAGYVAFLRERVAEVDAADLVWGVTKEKDGHVVVGTTRDATLEATTDSTREAKPNAWLTLLGEWQDRLVKTCTAALSAGIEERRVRLAEQQGALVADVIRGVLADLGLSAEQSAKVAEIVPRHLRLLTA